MLLGSMSRRWINLVRHLQAKSVRLGRFKWENQRRNYYLTRRRRVLGLRIRHVHNLNAKWIHTVFPSHVRTRTHVAMKAPARAVHSALLAHVPSPLPRVKTAHQPSRHPHAASLAHEGIAPCAWTRIHDNPPLWPSLLRLAPPLTHTTLYPNLPCSRVKQPASLFSRSVSFPYGQRLTQSGLRLPAWPSRSQATLRLHFSPSSLLPWPLSRLPLFFFFLSFSCEIVAGGFLFFSNRARSGYRKPPFFIRDVATRSLLLSHPMAILAKWKVDSLGYLLNIPNSGRQISMERSRPSVLLGAKPSFHVQDLILVIGLKPLRFWSCDLGLY